MNENLSFFLSISSTRSGSRKSSSWSNCENIEILIIASGIDSNSNQLTEIPAPETVPSDGNYLDEGLTFVDEKDTTYTDIPAITRKLWANKNISMNTSKNTDTNKANPD